MDKFDINIINEIPTLIPITTDRSFKTKNYSFIFKLL
jgi:hypothetical protein